MKVHFERTGGFAGLRWSISLDSDSLSPEEGQHLRELVEGAQFFELPKEITGSTEGADQFNYVIKIESEGRLQIVQTSEAAAPPTLRNLINWLTTMARKYRKG